jgi:hypothetical protein
MSDEINDALAATDWQARAEAAERLLADVTYKSNDSLKRAELAVEAVRAGMVDLDGLKLIDMTALSLDEKGAVPDAAAIITKLKRSKPWLFGSASSSSTSAAPRAESPKQRHAREMSEDEWRAARAALLKK